MRTLLQRVSNASVSVSGEVCGAIGPGLLILVGAEAVDEASDIEWLVQKVCKLRIFADDQGTMNRSVLDVGGEILAVSQFTLFASTRKGNRPSWSRAAPGTISQPLFDAFVSRLEKELGRPVPTGIFGADMQVSLTNDGPVTIFLDSQAPE